MSALLTANVIFLAVCAWLSVVKVIPDCATSHCRYRLWRLRDEVVDEIRHGEFDDLEKPTMLVTLVESAIEQASDLSALNLALLGISTRGYRPADPLQLDGLTPNDRERLSAHREEFEHAMILKAVFGTPSGWLFAVVVIPLGLLVAITGRVFRGNREGSTLIDDAKQHVFEELELNPAQALMKSSRTEGPRESLHQHV